MFSCDKDSQNQSEDYILSISDAYWSGDSVDIAGKFLLFCESVLGGVKLLENVPIPSQFKLVIGLYENVAHGCCIWAAGVFEYLREDISSVITKFSGYFAVAITDVLRQYSIHWVY